MVKEHYGEGGGVWSKNTMVKGRGVVKEHHGEGGGVWSKNVHMYIASQP